jgi:hypothetical protein
MLGSAEYFRARANDNSTQFLEAIYNDLLGRPLDAFGREAFTRLLTAGTARASVAQLIANSFEAQRRTVAGIYQRFLNRAPDAGGLAAFVNLLQRGTSEELVITLILGSEEYLRRA